MLIVDSHCHLDMLKGHDLLVNILSRAKQNGVGYMQTICTKLENFENIIKIAEKYPNIFASVGIHPSEVDNKLIKDEELINLAKHDKVIGIGETGLDYFYNTEKTQQKLQVASFEEHIKTSQINQLPVIIHTRSAEDDTHAILLDYKKQKNFPALIHCFTSSTQFAKKMLDLGLYISISGIVTFKNAIDIQKALDYIPIDRLLVETDSPYLAPIPMRGKTNEPAYVRHIVEFIAKLKNISPEYLAEATTKNFFELFTKAKQIN